MQLAILEGFKGKNNCSAICGKHMWKICGKHIAGSATLAYRLLSC